MWSVLADAVTVHAQSCDPDTLIGLQVDRLEPRMEDFDTVVDAQRQSDKSLRQLHSKVCSIHQGYYQQILSEVGLRMEEMDAVARLCSWQ